MSAENQAPEGAQLPLLPEPYWPREYFGGVPAGAYTADQMHTYARDALANVQPKGTAEPLAWVVWSDSGNCIMWSTDRAQAQAAADKYGRPLTALYAAPQTDQAPAPAPEPVATLWREKRQDLYPGPILELTEAGKALPLGVRHNLYAEPVQGAAEEAGFAPLSEVSACPHCGGAIDAPAAQADLIPSQGAEP